MMRDMKARHTLRSIVFIVAAAATASLSAHVMVSPTTS